MTKKIGVKEAMQHFLSVAPGMEEEPGTTIKKLTKQFATLMVGESGEDPVEKIQGSRTVAEIWENLAISHGYEPPIEFESALQEYVAYGYLQSDAPDEGDWIATIVKIPTINEALDFTTDLNKYNVLGEDQIAIDSDFITYYGTGSYEIDMGGGETITIHYPEALKNYNDSENSVKDYPDGDNVYYRTSLSDEWAPLNVLNATHYIDIDSGDAWSYGTQNDEALEFEFNSELSDATYKITALDASMTGKEIVLAFRETRPVEATPAVDDGGR